MVTLEGNPQDISSRLAAIEATIPHLATKADVADLATKADIAAVNAKLEGANIKIAELQVDIERGRNSLIKWFAGAAQTLAAILAPLLLMILDRLP